MLALKIIGIILAVLLLLVAVILMLPVDVLLRYSEEKGFQILYRLLGKIYGEEPDPDNKIVKALKKTVGISHLESGETIRRTVESHGAAVTLKETVETLMMLIERIIWLLKYCKVIRCRITAISGGEDAPLDYGMSCAVIYPFLAWLQANIRCGRRAVRTDIRCDNERDEGYTEFDIVVRVHMLHVLRALLHIIRENVEKEILAAEE